MSSIVRTPGGRSKECKNGTAQEQDSHQDFSLTISVESVEQRHESGQEHVDQEGRQDGDDDFRRSFLDGRRRIRTQRNVNRHYAHFAHSSK